MSGRHPKDWNGLDNAAKIFPATSNKEDGKVFRFSCELEEPVCCTDLQEALDQTMEFFPFYRSVLKKGLFWYYLKTSDLRPLVSEEDAPPCAPIYDTDRNCLLFSVTYYHRRINLEIYHALSDGTGALHFLRTLVACYLTIHHPELFPDGTPVIDYDATNSQKAEDSFKKYYKPGSKRYESKEKVYRLHGDKLPEGRIRVIEGRMSVSRILELSRSYHVSMTTFLSGILLQAISHNMSLSDKKKLVVLMVPVNLRNFFHSVSARNFF